METHILTCARVQEPQRYAFRGRTKRGGFAISSFCVVLAIKNTLFFDCEKSLSLIFGKPIKVCRSFHTGCRIENKCYILSPVPFELANYRVVKIKISL